MWKAIVENKTDLNVKCLRLDNVGENGSREFIDYCAESGVKMSKMGPMTPK